MRGLSRRSPGAEAAGVWDTPLRELDFTVVDCETTGLHARAGDRLVAVAAVRVSGGRVSDDPPFESLVDPRRPIPQTTAAIHGITDTMVAGAPAAPAVVAAFAEYAAGTVLVGHHLGFDLGFLRRPALTAGIQLPGATLDTMLLSAVLDDSPEARHGLDALTARLGVEVVGRHTAIGDARATAAALVLMIELLGERGIVTLGEAARAAAGTELAVRLRERTG